MFQKTKKGSNAKKSMNRKMCNELKTIVAFLFGMMFPILRVNFFGKKVKDSEKNLVKKKLLIV